MGPHLTAEGPDDTGKNVFIIYRSERTRGGGGNSNFPRKMGEKNRELWKRHLRGDWGVRKKGRSFHSNEEKDHLLQEN